jgi:hypothetical protein
MKAQEQPKKHDKTPFSFAASFETSHNSANFQLFFKLSSYISINQGFENT